jgi:Bacterial SH3 domain
MPRCASVVNGGPGNHGFTDFCTTSQDDSLSQGHWRAIPSVAWADNRHDFATPPHRHRSIVTRRTVLGSTQSLRQWTKARIPYVEEIAMKQTFTLFLTLIALAGCAERPAAQPAEPPARLAIAIMHVGAPVLTVYAQPGTDAPIVTTYGISETVSVLQRKDTWSEIRLTEGTGWVQSTDLITPEQQAELDKNPVPRFYVPPAAVPGKGHGQMTLEAKVNTDGQVIDVKVLQTTVRDSKTVEANVAALKQAKFYPLLQKGLRAPFTYEHKVVY